MILNNYYRIKLSLTRNKYINIIEQIQGLLILIFTALLDNKRVDSEQELIKIQQNTQSAKTTMIETIIQFNQHIYPFDSLDEDSSIKLQALVECIDSSHFVEYKKKFQSLKCLNNSYLIKLGQIFQEGLIIHLIFEHVPQSFHTHVSKQLEEFAGDDLLAFKKQIIKDLSLELYKMTSLLSEQRILTDLCYANVGVEKLTLPEKSFRIKYYLGTNFQFTQHSQQQLEQFYLGERKKVLAELQMNLSIQKRSDYLPLFIIRGNKIIFTDDLSETKTEKRRESSRKYDQPGPKDKRKQKTRNNKKQSKPKKHKYSCNFEQENLNFEYDEQKLNKSFQSDKDNYSITKTRSMKIEMQHQRPKQKNRKNSIKFKITTFQQISIDQSIDNERDTNNQDATENDFYSDMRDGSRTQDKQQKKDYRQKVREAKQRAENLLGKYMKNKNKFK